MPVSVNPLPASSGFSPSVRPICSIRPFALIEINQPDPHCVNLAHQMITNYLAQRNQREFSESDELSLLGDSHAAFERLPHQKQ